MDPESDHLENSTDIYPDTTHLLHHGVLYYLKRGKATNSESYINDLNDFPQNDNLLFFYSMPELSRYKGLNHSPRRLNNKNKNVSNNNACTNSNTHSNINPINHSSVHSNYQFSDRKLSLNESTALRPIGSTSTFTKSLEFQNSKFEDNADSSKDEHKYVQSVFWLVFDTLAAFLWVGPLVAILWYSTWTLSDRYFFSNNLEASYWLSFAIGQAVITIATLLQNQLLTFSANLSKPVQYVFMRVFNYVMSFASVSQWRGIWGLEDYYTGIYTTNALLTYILTTAALLVLQGQRTVLYPPTTVSVDVIHIEFYKRATFSSVPPGPSIYFLLDMFYTIFVIEPLSISVWRGLWELADCELYPDDKQSRAIWCIVGSYGLALVLVLLHVPTKRLAAYLEDINWYLMLAFEDIITALYVVFTVISWRGIWLVFEVFTPQHTDYLWIYHWLSFGTMVGTLCARSAMTQVGPKDGSIPKGLGVTLDIFYMRSILTEWLTKKGRKPKKKKNCSIF